LILLLDDCAAVGVFVLELFFMLGHLAQKGGSPLPVASGRLGLVAHVAERPLEPLLDPDHYPRKPYMEHAAHSGIKPTHAHAHEARQYVLEPHHLAVEEVADSRASPPQEYAAGIKLVALKDKQGYHPRDRYKQCDRKEGNHRLSVDPTRPQNN